MTQLRWKDVVEKVESVGLAAYLQSENLRGARQQAYSKVLDLQVRQKHDSLNNREVLKNTERQRAMSLAEQQYRDNLNLRLRKIHTEQQYQRENAEMVKQRYQRGGRQSGNFTEQSPFIRLANADNSRKEKQRDYIIKYREYNDEQQRLKQEKQQMERNYQAQLKSRHMDSLEKNHERRQQQRQVFNEKFLRIKESEGNIGSATKEANIEKAYQSFALSQVKMQKKMRNSDEVDNRLVYMNANILDSKASPAYLGRNFESYDRKKNLQMVERNIFRDLPKDVNSNQSVTSRAHSRDTIEQGVGTDRGYSPLCEPINYTHREANELSLRKVINEKKNQNYQAVPDLGHQQIETLYSLPSVDRSKVDLQKKDSLVTQYVRPLASERPQPQQRVSFQGGIQTFHEEKTEHRQPFSDSKRQEDARSPPPTPFSRSFLKYDPISGQNRLYQA